MRRFVSFGPAVVVLMAVIAVVFAAPAAIRQVDVARIAGVVLAAQNRLDSSNLLEQINRSYADIADAGLAGVVHIQARGARTMRFRDGDDENADRPRRTFPRASGSGWFYNDQGFIVTNAHVIEDADELRVELFDGRVRTAEVIGTDPQTDIALIKIDPGPGVSPLRRATGKPVVVGEQVFAFGSPFGIKFSMSRGIVSGLGRSEAASFVGMRGGYTNFIQTDAAINPGNSGGPLVDINGRVIAMNAAIANNAQWDGNGEPLQGQSAGIGFAIPLDTIESVVDQLMDRAVVLRGFLGVSLGPDFGPEYARATGVQFDGTGAVLAAVPDGQPASNAGLRAYDIVTAVDGHSVPNSDVLRSLISIRRPGQSVPVTVWRDGQIRTIDVRLGAAYNDPQTGLRYIPGSERMSLAEIRAALNNQPARVD